MWMVSSQLLQSSRKIWFNSRNEVVAGLFLSLVIRALLNFKFIFDTQKKKKNPQSNSLKTSPFQ